MTEKDSDEIVAYRSEEYWRQVNFELAKAEEELGPWSLDEYKEP